MSILSDLNPQALLAKVAIAGFALGGAYLWGHHNGYSSEKAAYDLYISQQAAKAETQVALNKSALLFQQSMFNLSQEKLQKDHQDEIDSLTANRDAALRDSGIWAERLRQYLARPSGRTVVVSGSASSASEPAASGQGSGGLSDGISDLNRYLTQRFYTADVNAATLNEAIDLIAKDREVCTGALPGVTTSKESR